MSTEAVIARHEAEYVAVQERLQLAQEELTQLKGRQDELQKALDVERAAWVSDKKTLEDTIVDLSTSERNAETDRSSREDDIRQLEERAKVSILSSLYFCYLTTFAGCRGALFQRSRFACQLYQVYREAETRSNRCSKFCTGQSHCC